MLSVVTDDLTEHEVSIFLCPPANYASYTAVPAPTSCEIEDISEIETISKTFVEIHIPDYDLITLPAKSCRRYDYYSKCWQNFCCSGGAESRIKEVNTTQDDRHTAYQSTMNSKINNIGGYCTEPMEYAPCVWPKTTETSGSVLCCSTISVIYNQWRAQVIGPVPRRPLSGTIDSYVAADGATIYLEAPLSLSRACDLRLSKKAMCYRKTDYIFCNPVHRAFKVLNETDCEGFIKTQEGFYLKTHLPIKERTKRAVNDAEALVNGLRWELNKLMTEVSEQLAQLRCENLRLRSELALLNEGQHGNYWASSLSKYRGVVEQGVYFPTGCVEVRSYDVDLARLRTKCDSYIPINFVLNGTKRTGFVHPLTRIISFDSPSQAFCNHQMSPFLYTDDLTPYSPIERRMVERNTIDLATFNLTLNLSDPISWYDLTDTGNQDLLQAIYNLSYTGVSPEELREDLVFNRQLSGLDLEAIANRVSFFPRIWLRWKSFVIAVCSVALFVVLTVLLIKVVILFRGFGWLRFRAHEQGYSKLRNYTD